MRGVPRAYYLAFRLVVTGAFVAISYPFVAVFCVVLSDRAALRQMEAWNYLAERMLGDVR